MAQTICQWIVIVASCIAIVAAIVSVTRKLTQIEGKIDSLSDKTNSLVTHINNHLELTGFMMANLPVNNKEKGELVKLYTNLSKLPSTPSNPFTPDEQLRYQHYIGKAQRGEAFIPNEVEDFQLLVNKFKDEHPNDSDILALLGLIALLIGLYLISQTKKEG